MYIVRSKLRVEFIMEKFNNANLNVLVNKTIRSNTTRSADLLKHNDELQVSRTIQLNNNNNKKTILSRTDYELLKTYDLFGVDGVNKFIGVLYQHAEDNAIKFTMYNIVHNQERENDDTVFT